MGDVEVGILICSSDAFSCWRSVVAKLRVDELRGGVVSPLGDAMTMVLLQRSHIPGVYVIGCLQVLQTDRVVDGVAACPLLNLKSKLDLVDIVSTALLESEVDERWDCEVFEVLSLFLAFSTALFSYSSQSFAVLPGVHGGGLGSLNGEFVLANGDEWCGANIVEVAMLRNVVC